MALFGSGGFVLAGISLFKFINELLTQRRTKQKEELADSTLLQRLQLEAGSKGQDNLTDNLWKIIGEKNAEIVDLKQEVRDCEKAEKLTRPAVSRIYECIRKIKNEMDSLNIMIMSDEETNVFARRWGNIKAIITDLEDSLDHSDAPNKTT